MIRIEGFVITPEMLKYITELDEFKAQWQFLGGLSPERLSNLKKVATIESIGSSTRIEGSKLSDTEVEALLSRLTTHSFRSRDEQEVAGYAQVCEEIFDSYQDIPFTENGIKQLHAWLLKYSDKDQRHRGDYKKFPNHVEAFDENGKSLGIIFETTSPFETPMKMQELIAWTSQTLQDRALHPLLIIALFVVSFLAIHPFQDGNGRLSRVLTTLLLLKSGYAYVPYSSLESVIEDNKERYYLALRRTQQTMKNNDPDWDPWILFFLKSLQKQKMALELKMAVKKTASLLTSDLSMPELSARILALIRERGRISTGEIERITQAKRSTIVKHLNDLVRAQHLQMHGKGRGTWYTLPL